MMCSELLKMELYVLCVSVVLVVNLKGQISSDSLHWSIFCNKFCLMKYYPNVSIWFVSQNLHDHEYNHLTCGAISADFWS